MSKLVAQVEELRDIKPDLTVQVYHPETGWPLPWYFRHIERAGFYPSVTPPVVADVVIIFAMTDPAKGFLGGSTAFLVEPLSVAVHGVRRSGLDAKTKVLVTGGGPIGLAAVAAARARGAEVDLVARHPAQKAGGRQIGAPWGEKLSGERMKSEG